MFFLLFAITINNSFSQDLKKSVSYYIEKCSSCHSIGDPDSELDGPDLTDALEYSKEELDESFDSMEEQIEEKISIELRNGLIDFFKSSDPVNILKEYIKKSENSFGEGLDDGDVKIGKSLYNGSLKFEKGAIACNSCHDQFGSDKLGGLLGPSLVGIYIKMGKARLFNGIRSSKYKVMKDIYNEKKVTDQEAVHLTTYFESVKDEKASIGENAFYGYGIGFMFFIFILLGIIYRNRLKE